MRYVDVSARGVSRANDIAPPPAAITRILSRFDREQLEGFVAVAIDLMDLADGDPDIEDGDAAEEDDPSGQCDEDGVNTSGGLYAHGSRHDGPGCPISDPGGGNVTDEAELVDEDGNEPFYRAKPVYGVDQTARPLNFLTAPMREQLEDQLAYAERCRDTDLAKHLRRRIASINAREARIYAREGVNQSERAITDKAACRAHTRMIRGEAR